MLSITITPVYLYKDLITTSTGLPDGVMMMLRRVQIDELQKTIDTLRASWADLSSESKNSPHNTD